MKNKIIAVTAASLFSMSPGAQSQELCGGYLEMGAKHAILQGVAPSVNCTIKKPGKCSIRIYAKMRAGELRGDTLWFIRKSKNDKWAVHLRVVKDLDTSDGITITVDDKDPMSIPSEFLSHGPAKYKNRGYVDGRLAQIVVGQIKTGKKAAITGTYTSGEKFTSVFGEKWFDGAGKIFDWADCMQKAR